MPVTAKLSRRFYETFGDDIANELVEWFNQVDATYRSDFRALFDTNFQRFDAKLEQRSAEVRGEMRAGLAETDAKMEQRIADLRGDVGAVAADLRGDLSDLNGRFTQLRADMSTGFATQRADLLRWMFIYWAGSVTATVGLVLVVANLLRR